MNHDIKLVICFCEGVKNLHGKHVVSHVFLIICNFIDIMLFFLHYK